MVGGPTASVASEDRKRAALPDSVVSKGVPNGRRGGRIGWIAISSSERRTVTGRHLPSWLAPMLTGSWRSPNGSSGTSNVPRTRCRRRSSSRGESCRACAIQLDVGAGAARHLASSIRTDLVLPERPDSVIPSANDSRSESGSPSAGTRSLRPAGNRRGARRRLDGACRHCRSGSSLRRTGDVRQSWRSTVRPWLAVEPRRSREGAERRRARRSR